MQMWTEIRRQVLTAENSKRAICREYNIHWGTLKKIPAHPGQTAPAVVTDVSKNFGWRFSA